MKIETKQRETENWSSAAQHILTEPFLVIGMALFWAVALPVAAVFFSLITAFEPVLAYLDATRRTPAVAGHRLARRATA
jgi:hypothetical protein